MLCFAGPFFWTVYSLWRKNASFPLAALLSLLVAAELHNMPQLPSAPTPVSRSLLHWQFCLLREKLRWERKKAAQVPAIVPSTCSSTFPPPFPCCLLTLFSVSSECLHSFSFFLFFFYLWCFASSLELENIWTWGGWAPSCGAGKKCLEWIVLFKTPFYSGWCGCLFEILGK